jgi:hypothetical protein
LQTVQKATNLPHQSAYSKALVATLLKREEFAAQQLFLAMEVILMNGYSSVSP